MKIHNLRFSVKNSQRNWVIEDVDFGNLNLLVGESGVGKTTILRSIDLICDIAKGKRRNFSGIKWCIDFSQNSKKYRWELESNQLDQEFFDGEIDEVFESEVHRESLIEIDNGQRIFERNPSIISFGSYEKLPKIKSNESMIHLFEEEDVIQPVLLGFNSLSYQKFSQEQLILRIGANPFKVNFETEKGFDEFKSLIVQSPIVLKVFFTQHHFPDRFHHLKESFLRIFPSIVDLCVQVEEEESGIYSIFFKIKEAGSDQWISQPWISSGMLRSLYFLSELLLAPKESVILIDEFENSLGINCMSDITDLILDDENDTQFILTSHHPYIINKIPWDTWQLVSRQGNTIRVNHSTDIPELNTASSLDRFTQLISYWEFKSAQK